MGNHIKGTKAVKSDDPRKPGFMDMLKTVSRCSRVTTVREDFEFAYGDCLELGHTPNGSRHYAHKGTFKVPKDGKGLDGYKVAI